MGGLQVHLRDKERPDKKTGATPATWNDIAVGNSIIFDQHRPLILSENVSRISIKQNTTFLSQLEIMFGRIEQTYIGNMKLANVKRATIKKVNFTSISRHLAEIRFGLKKQMSSVLTGRHTVCIWETQSNIYHHNYMVPDTWNDIISCNKERKQ